MMQVDGAVRRAVPARELAAMYQRLAAMDRDAPAAPGVRERIGWLLRDDAGALPLWSGDAQTVRSEILPALEARVGAAEERLADPARARDRIYQAGQRVQDEQRAKVFDEALVMFRGLLAAHDEREAAKPGRVVREVEPGIRESVNPDGSVSRIVKGWKSDDPTATAPPASIRPKIPIL
jgi:hypothetical protein